jgi:hypothetical protein
MLGSIDKEAITKEVLNQMETLCAQIKYLEILYQEFKKLATVLMIKIVTTEATTTTTPNNKNASLGTIKNGKEFLQRTQLGLNVDLIPAYYAQPTPMTTILTKVTKVIKVTVDTVVIVDTTETTTTTTPMTLIQETIILLVDIESNEINLIKTH